VAPFGRDALGEARDGPAASRGASTPDLCLTLAVLVSTVALLDLVANLAQTANVTAIAMASLSVGSERT
jgi:hypothetical protein